MADKDVFAELSPPYSCGQHSEKPPAFLDLVEKASPGPYVELRGYE